MRKKTIFVLLAVMLLLLVACKQKTEKVQAPKIETTGDAAVDSVGKDIGNVDSIEKDLNIDELNDLDSGLDEIQNI